MRLGHQWTGVAVSSQRSLAADFAAVSETFWAVHEMGGVLICNKCPITDKLAPGVPRMFCADGVEVAHWCDVLIAVVSPDRTGGAEIAVSACEAMGKEIIFV